MADLNFCAAAIDATNRKPQKKFLQLKLQRNIAKSRILSLVKMKF